MPLSLTEDEQKSIADDLNCGFKVFIDVTTGEIQSFPDPEEMFEILEDLEEIWDEIQANREKYLEIEKMSSFEAFRVMEEFTESLPDNNFRARLETALTQPKPFRKFKALVDTHGDYREVWFAFKFQKTVEWVQAQLNNFNTESAKYQEPE